LKKLWRFTAPIRSGDNRRICCTIARKNANGLITMNQCRSAALNVFLETFPEHAAAFIEHPSRIGMGVAVVGAGQLADRDYYLRQLGHSVTVYEQCQKAVGCHLQHTGIPAAKAMYAPGYSTNKYGDQCVRNTPPAPASPSRSQGRYQAFSWRLGSGMREKETRQTRVAGLPGFLISVQTVALSALASVCW
jgi:hypothetical protein